MAAEIQDYVDILLGREDPPVGGTLSLYECADAFYARGMEMTMLIQEGERKGTVVRNDSYYRFRTGELRTFCEMAKRAADLGSRRITEEQLRFEREKLGRESV